MRPAATRTCWSRIGKANRKGQFDVVARSVTPVTADPYLTSYGRIAHVY